MRSRFEALALVALAALAGCTSAVREPPHCDVASCCPGGGYVYQPLEGCVPASRPPLCGCVCKGGRPYDTLAECERAVRDAKH